MSRCLAEAPRSVRGHLVRSATCRLPTMWGMFRLHAFLDDARREHLAIVMGDVKGGSAPLLRIHSECLTGDALFSARCDCGEQLRSAFKLIGAEGRGVILYLRQEGRGIGLANKLAAYALQDQGLDTVDANHQLGFPSDLREYSVAVTLLQALGIRSVRLLTNNPVKMSFLEENGIEVASRLPLICKPNPHNIRYLQTKAERLGHLIGSHRGGRSFSPRSSDAQGAGERD